MFEQFTQLLVDWIRTLPPISIYLVFFLIAYVENVVPPIPGDLLVAFAGYLAAEQVIELVPVYALTTVASVVGFMTMYAVGHRWGWQVRDRKTQFWLLRFIDIKYIRRVRMWMNKWGQGVIVANRFLAGTRSVISLTAGISHTTIRWTIVSSLVSSAIWNGILLGFGLFVHENWQIIGEYLSVYSRIILIILVLLGALRWGWVRYKKSRRAQVDKR